MLLVNVCGCVNLNLLLLPPSSLTMHPIPSDKHQIIISLLLSGVYTREIERKTGVGKLTVGRTRKEVEPDKENIKKGRPPKLSPHDKRRIINQIESGKLGNAVQASDFIISINTIQVGPQTARIAMKEDNMKSVVKKKCPLLKQVHRKDRLNWALKHQHWTVEGLDDGGMDR